MNYFLRQFQSKSLFALHIVHPKLYHFLVAVCSTEYVVCTYTLVLVKKNIALTHLENEVDQKWGWISLACRNFLSENGKRDPGTRITRGIKTPFN